MSDDVFGYVRALLKALDEAEAQEVGHVADGGLTHEEYRSRTGVIAGLRKARGLVVERMKDEQRRALGMVPTGAAGPPRKG